MLCGYCHRVVTQGWKCQATPILSPVSFGPAGNEEVQAGSECQAVGLEKGAVGRWGRGMLLSICSPFPRREGGKEGTSHHLESAHWKLAEPH